MILQDFTTPVIDFDDNGSIKIGSLKYLSEEIHRQIKNYTISTNNVYISIAGTIGKTGVVPRELNGANLTENAAKIVISDKCLRDYLYFFTTTSLFKKQAIKIACKYLC